MSHREKEVPSRFVFTKMSGNVFGPDFEASLVRGFIKFVSFFIVGQNR